MKGYNLFDVVELNNGNKATILTKDNSIIRIEEVNDKGQTLGIREITDNEIKQVIFRK